MVEQIQTKLMTKKDFDIVRSKFIEIKPEALKEIDSAKNSLDVIALQIQEGSGYKVLGAKLIDEENDEDMIQLFKEGTIN